MAETVKVATSDELKEGEIKAVNVAGLQIALYRIGSQVFATSDICTHQGCLLSESFNLKGTEVECTCHGSRFNIQTGDAVQEPAVQPLKIYPARIEGNDVLVEV